MLASNKGFEEWGSVLGGEVMAAALVDRLLHHCHIVNIRGNSYRMKVPVRGGRRAGRSTRGLLDKAMMDGCTARVAAALGLKP